MCPFNAAIHLRVPLFRSFALLIGFLLLDVVMAPSVAWAKGLSAPKVEPIVHNGIRYVAPNDKGSVAYVEAWDIPTGKFLWKRTVFRTFIRPWMEHCIQWVFIREMKLEGEQLVIVSDRAKIYSLDLKTKRVRRLKPKPEALSRPVAL